MIGAIEDASLIRLEDSSMCSLTTPCSLVFVAATHHADCVRTVSHTPPNLGSTPAFTRTGACTSLLWEVVDRECVGGI